MVIFDCFSHIGKPANTLPKLKLHANELWATQDRTGLPDRLDLITSSDLICINIEHWPAGDAKYEDTMLAVRAMYPGHRFGIYGIAPKRDYWRATKDKAHPDFRAWQRENDQASAVARNVDVLFPSLYTFYDDREGWVKYAVANIQEARRLANGKPVIPFLWFEYHGSNQALANTNIPGDFWRLQLETCRDHADGCVIWGGWKRQWDESAEWWQVTKSFQ